MIIKLKTKIKRVEFICHNTYIQIMRIIVEYKGLYDSNFVLDNRCGIMKIYEEREISSQLEININTEKWKNKKHKSNDKSKYGSKTTLGI